MKSLALALLVALAALGCIDVNARVPEYIGPEDNNARSTSSSSSTPSQLPSGGAGDATSQTLYAENQQLREQLRGLEEDRRQWEAAVDQREQQKDQLEEQLERLEDD